MACLTRDSLHDSIPSYPSCDQFSIYELLSIIATNESTGRNLELFTHHHYPNTFNYSDRSNHPPFWRKQALRPLPPLPGSLQQTTFHPLDFDSQPAHTRIQAAERRQRSEQFLNEQDQQRAERETEAEAVRKTKVMGAVSKLGMGSSLTLEERFIITQEAYERERKRSDRNDAGLAGAEIGAQKAMEEAEAFPERQVHDGRARMMDAEQPTSLYRAEKRESSNIMLQIFEFLIFIISIFLYILSCPNGFRLCPCGIIKRPFHLLATLCRSLAKNRILLIAPLLFFLAHYWREILECAVPVLLGWVQFLALMVLLLGCLGRVGSEKRTKEGVEST